MVIERMQKQAKLVPSMLEKQSDEDDTVKSLIFERIRPLLVSTRQKNRVILCKIQFIFFDVVS